MFERCEVVTRKQILALAGAFAVLGWIAAGLAQTYLEAHAPRPAPRIVRSVQILRSTAIETVARIKRPTAHGIETCTLTVNHTTQYWSLAC